MYMRIYVLLCRLVSVFFWVGNVVERLMFLAEMLQIDITLIKGWGCDALADVDPRMGAMSGRLVGRVRYLSRFFLSRIR